MMVVFASNFIASRFAGNIHWLKPLLFNQRTDIAIYSRKANALDSFLGSRQSLFWGQGTVRLRESFLDGFLLARPPKLYRHSNTFLRKCGTILDTCDESRKTQINFQQSCCTLFSMYSVLQTRAMERRRIIAGVLLCMLLAIFAVSAKVAMYHPDHARSLASNKMWQQQEIGIAHADPPVIEFPGVALALLLLFATSTTVCFLGYVHKPLPPRALIWFADPAHRRPPPCC